MFVENVDIGLLAWTLFWLIDGILAEKCVYSILQYTKSIISQAKAHKSCAKGRKIILKADKFHLNITIRFKAVNFAGFCAAVFIRRAYFCLKMPNKRGICIIIFLPFILMPKYSSKKG